MNMGGSCEEKLNFITDDEKIKSVLHEIPKFALTDIPVLISGESGTGKEIIANFVHLMSQRREKPFIAINCAAIPNELLESELFGHKKGAFTGAASDHIGLFEMADGGTVFLDEIGDMPLMLQAKILRIIQEKRIRRVGDSRERYVNFRIVSATHKQLNDEVKSGQFREDLFYRLSGYSIYIPALRQRPGDIRHLVEYFSSRISEKYRIPIVRYSERALQKLEHYSWPGNVRQLENVVEQLAIRGQGEVVDGDFVEKSLPLEEVESDFYFSRYKNLPTLAELTENYIDYVSNKVNYQQAEAAKILGISRRTLHRKNIDSSLKPKSFSDKNFFSETKNQTLPH